MENRESSIEQAKEREYNEIQEKATQSGFLEGIDTHVSSDIEIIMNTSKNAPLMAQRNPATPGLGMGVEGTGITGDSPEEIRVKNSISDLGEIE